MDLILILVIIGAAAYIGYRFLNKENDDGSHPLDGATKAPYKLEPSTTTKPDGIGHESITIQPVISNVLDVNNDGKVDVEDVKAAVEKTKKKVKEVTDEVVEKVKKPRGRKPKAE